jgi:hypothetical protein
VAVVEAYLAPWQGAIDPAGLNLTVGITFTDVGGRMEGRYVVPPQGIEGALLVRDAAQTTIAFVLQGVPGEATFEGELVGDTITGTFSQSGQTLPFTLERTGKPCPCAARKILYRPFLTARKRSATRAGTSPWQVR